MPLLKKTSFKQPLLIRTHTLTPDLDDVLQRLSQEASDHLGWTVSSSAVIRALVQFATQQPPAWAAGTLHPLIEAEIAAGRVWGRKKE